MCLELSLSRKVDLIRPLIGDANLLVRTGIRAILTETFAITEVGEASSGAEVIEHLRQRPWSLCILDVSLPERGGLEIGRYIRKGHRKTPLLFLCSRSDRQYAATALREGAKGFILRDCSREDFVIAVRTVLDGGIHIGPDVSDHLITHDGDDRPPYARLSQRELQIFRKLALGTALTVISRALSISPKSVSTYRSRILEKMQCNNNAEITSYAIREGII
jgi:two-component system, NarL family, invasion response regulator UvrY